MSGVSLSVAAYDVEWLQRDYDFGTWGEDDGLRDGSVAFVNRGDAPVMIRRVRPSCGCTGVSYDEGLIAPGDTAVVRFNYNPEGRPGAFAKTIKVYLDNDEKPTVINIRGTVIGVERSLHKRYPVDCGPMRLTDRVIDFGDVTFGKVRHLFITAYNQSREPVSPDISVADPDGKPLLPVDFKMAQSTVHPGEQTSISIYFNSGLTRQMGRTESVRRFCAGDTCVDIVLRANIIPDTSSLTPEQLKQAPLLALEKQTVDLGGIAPTKKKRFSVTLRNDGASDLRISRVYATTPEGRVCKFPSVLKPGKKGELEVEVDPSAEGGDIISGVVEIVTNDPLTPVATVKYIALKKR